MDEVVFHTVRSVNCFLGDASHLASALHPFRRGPQQFGESPGLKTGLGNKPPPLTRDYDRDPNIWALEGGGFMNHGSTLGQLS